MGPLASSARKQRHECLWSLSPVYSDVDPNPQYDTILIQGRSCTLSSFSVEMASRTHTYKDELLR